MNARSVCFGIVFAGLSFSGISTRSIADSMPAAVQLTFVRQGASGVRSPRFSPDGKRIACCSDLDGGSLEIYVLPSAGGKLARLTGSERWFESPSWSPDGSSLAFVGWGPPDYIRGVYVLSMTPDAAPRALMSEDTGPAPLSCAWSPDGLRIVYSMGSPRLKQLDLFSIPAGGGPATRLTATSAESDSPAWSPHGDRIAFASNRGGTWQIWVADSEGHAPVQITQADAFEATTPAWSPDGTWLAFARGWKLDREHRDLWIMHADGSGGVQVTSDPGDDFQPSWSPDGKRLVFSSNRDGQYNLWVIPVP